MLQNYRLSSWVLVLLMSWNVLPVLAQQGRKDSTNLRHPTSTAPAVQALQAALRKPAGSLRVADSLLTQARQQDYLPGQVVALSQVAGFRLQQQQPQQASALLQEAERVAAKLRDLHDAGWALKRVSALREQYGNAPGWQGAVGPVMSALGTAMGRAAVPKSMPVGPTPEQIRKFSANAYTPVPPAVELSNTRLGHGRAAALLGTGVPTPPSSAAAGAPPARVVQPRLGVIERWIDTLLTRGQSPPQVAQQLQARRKRRDSSQALSQAYAKEGDYARAYRYFLQYSAYKDSLTAEATTRRLAALEYKQNLLRKEAQIQRLKKEQLQRQQAAHRQQQYLLGLAGCVAGLVGFAVVLGRNNRAKHQANRQLSVQKEALQQALAELKNTQNQLIQAEKMASLGELTAGIAHEIQNPLNFVNNFSEVSAELLQELKEVRQENPRDVELEEELLEDVRQNLEKINQHGNRASAIVKGMLEHARANPGQKELVDLNALTEEYANLAYHGTRAKHHDFQAQLTRHFDPALGPVAVVPQDLSRVLMNVFSNAFYAVQKKQSDHVPGYRPEIWVCTKREADHVKIQIRDNGTGVPAALKQKVFQPFFTTKPSGQGTGLGLSLSYDIVTKGHGGTFTLESEEGQFTELTLTLPVATT